MITIDKVDFEEQLDNYGIDYGRRFLQSLTTASFIDSSYAKEMVQQLDTFVPILRLQGINDTTMLYQDIRIAQQLQNDYDSYGDYCYDMLKQCFQASNECMVLNNKLAHDLTDLLNFRDSDISIGSDYIAINTFSACGGKVTLTNFKHITGIGLTYNIAVNAHGPGGIRTNRIQETIDSQLLNVIEMSEFLMLIQNPESKLNKLLLTWSATVNDKLANSKNIAILPWISFYEANKQNWGELQLSKQVKEIIGTLIVKHSQNETIINEILHRKGKSKTINYGSNIGIVAQLDYLNSMNLRFL